MLQYAIAVTNREMHKAKNNRGIQSPRASIRLVPVLHACNEVRTVKVCDPHSPAMPRKLCVARASHRKYKKRATVI